MSWKCTKCGEANDEKEHLFCWNCGKSRYSDANIGDGPERHCSTTREIPGRTIAQSKGVVFGEAILGANIVRDIFAGITDIVGGRSGAYESKLREGRETAMKEMLLEAHSRGADAVVGIDVDYENMEGMIMICVSGTAVLLEEENDG